MAKIAFLFPGQGSQKIGMGGGFLEAYPQANSLFEQANQILGFDLKTLCLEGPEEVLKATENTQPALYVTSIIAWSCFTEATGIVPQACAGHSVGEYAALTAAGVFSFEEGLQLVRRRGELMRDAAQQRQGGMIALLGTDAETSRAVCEEVRALNIGIVVVANYNGAGQYILSGESAALEKATEVAKAKGVRKVVPLPVSGAFHSPLMVVAGDALFAHINKVTLHKPKVPVVSNISAAYVEMPDDILGGLTRQVSGSVRWEESMQRLLAEGFDTFIELGSGKVLTGLMKKMQETVVTLNIEDAASLEVAKALLEA
jgi:[acyl-carrier-protein] S-malonyltransferase